MWQFNYHFLHKCSGKPHHKARANVESCLYLPEGWICLNQAWALLGLRNNGHNVIIPCDIICQVMMDESGFGRQKVHMGVLKLNWLPFLIVCQSCFCQSWLLADLGFGSVIVCLFLCVSVLTDDIRGRPFLCTVRLRKNVHKNGWPLSRLILLLTLCAWWALADRPTASLFIILIRIYLVPLSKHELWKEKKAPPYKWTPNLNLALKKKPCWLSFLVFGWVSSSFCIQKIWLALCTPPPLSLHGNWCTHMKIKSCIWCARSRMCLRVVFTSSYLCVQNLLLFKLQSKKKNIYHEWIA